MYIYFSAGTVHIYISHCDWSIIWIMDPTWDLLYGYNHNGTPMQQKRIDRVLEEYATTHRYMVLEIMQKDLSMSCRCSSIYFF